MTDRRRVFPLLLLGLALGVACDQVESPVEPDSPDPRTEAVQVTDPPGDPDRAGPFSSRARFIDPQRFRVRSGEEQLAAGQYRLPFDDSLAGAIERDDIVVVAVDGADPEPRVVLSAQQQGSELVLETGPALWSEVVISGRYGLKAPIGPGPAVATGDILLPDLQLQPDVDINPIGSLFELDLCAEAESLMGDPLCGEERDISFSVGAQITLAGKVDSLSVLNGDAQLSGSFSIDLAVDGGGVIGGRPPVFAPCNENAYLGCIPTPTGANLIDWLRTYAPDIPEASLPSVRVCIPGTPVRVSRGYWVYPGFPSLPYWVRPVFEQCRITDVGALPEVVLPSIQHVDAVFQPRVRGEITLYGEGDGKLGLKIPIPSLGYSAGFEGGQVTGKASAGIFVGLTLTVKNTSAQARTTFDEEVRVTQSWSPAAGWDSQTESIRSDQGVEPTFGNPDSLVLKVAMIAEAKAEVEFAPLEEAGVFLDWLALGAKAGLSLGPFVEATMSREQIDPANPDIDNWHISTDMAYEIKPTAGIEIPDVFNFPDVDLEWDPTFEFGRVGIMDAWGRANLVVAATTDGTDIDVDGYTAVVTRADTLPVLLDPGAQRAGPAFDHGSPLEMALGGNDEVVFGAGVLPCGVVYSDVALAAAVGFGGVEVLRAVGITIPNYGTFTPTCDLVVARYTVELTGVAENCFVAGGATREDVWLLQRRWGFEARADTTRVEFEVSCGSPGAMGDVEVTADIPTVLKGPYQVRVDGQPWGLIEPGETRTLLDLAAGERSVELTGLPAYCVAEPETVLVLEDATASATITPACDIPVEDLIGAAVVTVTSSGGSEDADGFLLKLDGVTTAGVAPGETEIIPDLPALTPGVLLLGAIDGHCRTTTANPVVFALDADRNPVDVVFGTECTAAAVDTLIGEVSTTTWPVPSASVEAPEGEALQLVGPTRSDFLQLAGTTVQVWGVRMGTSLDVYGYSVRSSLGEPRWVGIVMERDGELWLFGEEAVRLVNPPPFLEGQTGALVWVAGTEVQPGSVIPQLYGVIRGGS